MEYGDFLKSKELVDHPSGFDWDGPLTNSGKLELFPFQEAIVKWALKRGRAGVFADTGLGKTAIQAAWAWCVHQYTGNRVLILAPLCVALQTVNEADKFGIPIRYVREMPHDEFGGVDTGIYITNYEMLDKFELSPWFDGIVLDESSILKSQDSKTRTKIIKACQCVPYRLSCTATPSPNDYMEIGNQAEFLGIMGIMEMLSMFFVHDSGQTSKWRLKGHGTTRFWEWLSNWALFMRKPSDLGFDDEGYNLPPLEIEEVVVKTGEFFEVAKTLGERNSARKISTNARVKVASEIANSSDDYCIVWCHLNDESSKLKSAIPDSVEVKGSDKTSDKESRLMGFVSGNHRVLVSKPEICGFGLNFQHCNQMIFVGLNDSYEQLYQAIRRCYRFGQKRPVKVTLITADIEGAVLENIKRKEKQHQEMADSMIEHMRDFSKRKVLNLVRDKTEYFPKEKMDIPTWLH